MDGFNPRIEKWEIPLDAIKEALTNSICHRDHYDTAANIMVELYNDRMEITNPGGLLPKEKPNANRIFYFRFGVTLEYHLPNWQRYSKSRNGQSKETLPIFVKQTRLCDKVETKAENGLSCRYLWRSKSPRRCRSSESGLSGPGEPWCRQAHCV